MRRIPLDIGPLHFVGIGGIGMSGIAEILHNLGYTIQGSDLAENANVARLRAKGISISIGHHADNLGHARVLVVSSAVRQDNPEVIRARSKHIPVVRRAEMLAELMRLKSAIAVGGTHGKTTTTSLIATLLDTAGLDPTVINGGIINAYATNARLGDGEWMVVEADESDGTFTKLPATIAIVTNIDPEHMDHYKTFDTLREAFHTFVTNIPFYGFACLCIDHPEVQALIGRVTDRRIITYGFNPQADIRGIDVHFGPEGARFNVIVRGSNGDGDRQIDGFSLPMFGEHNVLNALATIASGLTLKIDEALIRMALSEFDGVKRRFTKTGEAHGVTIIDDYAHHPVEIAAVLHAARHACRNKVVAVMQPHRYSRLRDLFDHFCTCFNDADHILVADVYAAGETPVEGISRDSLVEGLRNHGHRSVQALKGPETLAQQVRELVHPGDFVVCLGAGSITTWAHELPGQLSGISPKTGKETTDT